MSAAEKTGLMLWKSIRLVPQVALFVQRFVLSGVRRVSQGEREAHVLLSAP